MICWTLVVFLIILICGILLQMSCAYYQKPACAQHGSQTALKIRAPPPTSIRLEVEGDYFHTEIATRDAFWNKFHPGADEHFLLHVMRSDPDFIPELCFVALDGEKIVGSIAFTKAKIVQEGEGEDEGEGKVLPIVSFGPVSVIPSYQSKGVGRQLISHALKAARDLGHQAVAFNGDPRYYGRLGFRCGERYDITNADGEFAISLMVMALTDSKPSPLEAFGGGRFEEASVFQIFTGEGLEEYDAAFPTREKLEMPYHTEFAVIRSIRYKATAHPLL